MRLRSGVFVFSPFRRESTRDRSGVAQRDNSIISCIREEAAMTTSEIKIKTNRSFVLYNDARRSYIARGLYTSTWWRFKPASSLYYVLDEAKL